MADDNGPALQRRSPRPALTRCLRDVLTAAGDRLEPSLQRALDAVGTDPASPVAGCACLYGGSDYPDRAAPGQEPRSRLHGYGPAFFTKFLYFSTPGALILDSRLASAVCNPEPAAAPPQR